jgi:hypothetical protein
MIATYAIPFFLVMGFIVGPLFLFLLCRWLLPRRYGRKVGMALAVAVILLVGYGMKFGFETLEVRQLEYVSSDLPEAFDGYRIVHFTDAHIGTFEDSRSWLLQRMVDSINAQHADAIVFTGDLQNLGPDDLTDKLDVLSKLKAPDGVFSVLGNHDYEIYVDTDEATRRQHDLMTQQLERRAGWTLLMNEHRIVRRDSDSIVIAGMENWGKVKRMPRRGDVKKTLNGLNINPSAKSAQSKVQSHQPFILMLQHDPSAWREKILPECHAQLTLSGHTHGGQFSLFGWSPVAVTTPEWGGLYQEGDRALFVSAGVGGLIPFRLNMPGEIVVVTLRRK